MTPSLSERLHKVAAKWPSYSEVGDILLQAADALDQKDVMLSQAACTNVMHANELLADIAAKDKEIERLRVVLESLTKDPPSSLASEPDTDCEVVLKMREIARVALGGK